MDKLLLRTDEAAELLGLSRTRVYALIKKGEIDSIKVGNARRIPTTAANEYVSRKLAEARDAVA